MSLNLTAECVPLAPGGLGNLDGTFSADRNRIYRLVSKFAAVLESCPASKPSVHPAGSLANTKPFF